MALRPPAPDRDWRGFVAAVLIAVACLVAGYIGLAIVLDPYETGRSTLLTRMAVRPQGPRTGVVLRGRNPAYNGAVIGNSHIQLVEPAALSRATGIPFVQLSVPATGPSEQFAILDWFLRHHPHPDAIVLSADSFWCADDASFSSEHPFPYWLIEDWPAYLRGLLRFAAAEETVVRLGWLFDPRRKSAAADGWWNYENDYLAQGFGRDPALVARLDHRVGPDPDPHHGGPFPIAGRFRAALARIPATTPVVLVFPPIYAAAEAQPGSRRAQASEACRAAIRTEFAEHSLGAVVDWRNGRPQSSDASLFFDQTHYRLPVGQAVTGEIAAAILEMRRSTAR
jgi:hypothetical protein